MNPFTALLRDSVFILDKEGKRSGPHKAALSSKSGTSATIFEASLDGEEGFELVRQLPNGKEEIYSIAECNFTHGVHAVPSHWTLKLTKGASLPLKSETITDPRMNSWNVEEAWRDIKTEYDIDKRAFGKKIDFVVDPFKRDIIFRDVAQAHALVRLGFLKPAVILVGSVTEELLRLFLISKNVKITATTFDSYIKACIDTGLLKPAVYRLTDSFRHFRNLIHLQNEDSAKHTISMATAKGAVASIFTITNDF